MAENLLLLAEGEGWVQLGIAVLAVGGGAGVVKLIDYLRRRDVEKEAAMIRADAEKDKNTLP